MPTAEDALRGAYAENPLLRALVEEQQRLEDDRAAPSSAAGCPRFDGRRSHRLLQLAAPRAERIRLGIRRLHLGSRHRRPARCRNGPSAHRGRAKSRWRSSASFATSRRWSARPQHAAAERLAALAIAEQAVGQAEENLRIRRQQFDAGRASSDDVLDAQACSRISARCSRPRSIKHTSAAPSSTAHGTRLGGRHRARGIHESTGRSSRERWSQPCWPVACSRGDANGGPLHYTGFVEGEERIIRSEVAGRVLEVRVRRGRRPSPPDAVVAVLDDRDMAAQIEAKRHEIAVYEPRSARNEDRSTMVDSTWKRETSARRAELAQAEAGATLAEQTFVREQALVSHRRQHGAVARRGARPARSGA